MRNITMTFIFFGFLLHVSPAWAVDALPFGPGERMKYEIYWAFIHAADAELEVMENVEMDGVPARYFLARARSASWIDSIYKVRDTIEAWTDMGVTYSLRYKKDQNEGSYHKKVDLIFDKTANQSYRYARGKLQHTIDQPADVFDPMSILFSFRKIPLYEGMHFVANVSDGKKSVKSEAFVEGVETVKTPRGKFKTYKVKLDIKHLSGVFQKSKDAELYVWFSADERRIPVKVKSKVTVGYFTMELVDYRPPRVVD
ncbi:DUF3108 domain-containing protein [Pseudodesulfovibrio sp. S3]|uniref:DUF3108 domain-containing protein n=2 Tax=unclassified Pseudodesulfovibrio TaxID=2661612 RepID=UPI001F4FB43E|nr:DUF3108 domain-containing protein [Pseudodesulfovibrio sp. S3]MCJ2164889.1 DUF3108 domain-containing protein [Pseudodesulfovibrio sp. S3-i]